MSRELGVSLEELRSPSRSKRLVRDRATIATIVRDITPASLGEIGRQLGRTDHTTVMNLTRKAEVLINQDPDFAEQFSRLKDMGSLLQMI